MTEIVKQETMGFMIHSNKINSQAVEKVNRYLPELEEKTRAFGSNNSQTTLSLMTLTMLGGQSPYRMLRQIMAEVEKRKSALSEAQVNYAKSQKEIERLEGSDDPVEMAKYRHKCVSLSTMENKINGSFKDIATLIDAYNNIKKVNGIEDWDEVAFEKEEKGHLIRRAFELMYRNLIDSGRAKTSTIEYCQQYGIHPQVCLTEVTGYVNHVAERISKHDTPHGNDLEEFLDQMGEKYKDAADKTSERIFGKADFINKDYMYEMMKEKFTQ